MPNAYVARFTFNDDPEYWLNLYLDKSSLSDLEWLLSERASEWSMPRSCFPGDIVFFQLAVGALRPINRLLTAVGDTREFGRQVRRLKTLAAIADRYAGCLVACGKVHGPPEASDEVDYYTHWKGRVYASINPIVAFREPLRVTGDNDFRTMSAFAPAGPVTHRMFGSESDLERTVAALKTAGNKLPLWLTSTRIKQAGDDDPRNLLARLRDLKVGFLSEEHLVLHMAEPICTLIADEGLVRQQATVRPDRLQSGGVVDLVIKVDGIAVPVEAKLNISAEHDLRKQVRKYTGPARVGKSERIEHGIVVVIDQSGVYLFVNGEIANGGEPVLERTALTQAALKKLRQTIKHATSQ